MKKMEIPVLDYDVDVVEPPQIVVDIYKNDGEDYFQAAVDFLAATPPDEEDPPPLPAKGRKRGRPSVYPKPAKKPRTHDWDKIPCLLCNKPYQTVGNLQKHMVANHHICDPVCQIKCAFCGNVFSDEVQFQTHSDGSSRKLARNTGALARLQQDQVELSRVLRKIAREEAQEEGDQKREETVKVLEKFFDYVQPAKEDNDDDDDDDDDDCVVTSDAAPLSVFSAPTDAVDDNNNNNNNNN